MHSKPFGTIAVPPRVALPRLQLPLPWARPGRPLLRRAGDTATAAAPHSTPVGGCGNPLSLPLPRTRRATLARLFVFPLDALQTRSRFPGGGCLGRDEWDDFLQGTIRGRCPPSRVVFSSVRIRGDELPVAAVNRCEHLVIKSPALIPGSRAKQLRGPASKSRSQLLKP